MKNRTILFIFILISFLLTGCGSDQNASGEETDAATEGVIAPISTTLNVEACEALSLDPAEYLIIDDAVDPSMIELHFESVDPTVCGKYLVSAFYEGKAVYFNVQIIDTTAPEIIVKEDIPVFSTHSYIRCEDLAEAKDVTDTHMSFDSDGISWYFSPDEPGNYTLKIVARDSSDNISETTVTITVEDLAIALAPAAEAQIKNDDTLPQIFKDFLLGEATAMIGENIDFGNIYAFSFSSPISSGQAGTLQDMIQMINNGGSHGDYFLTTVKYGILDCGMDGKPDLALQFYFGVGHIDACIMTTILHEEDGRLIMNFADQTWSRTWSALYQDGYYVDGGSGGAATEIFCYYMLDKSGRTQPLYECLDHWDSYISLTGGAQAKLDYFDYESEDEFTMADQEKLQNILKYVVSCDYTVGENTYNSYCISPGASDEEKEAISHYISLCEENGARFYSIEDIRKAIDKRAASLGFPDWNIGHEEADEVDFQILFESQLSEEYEALAGGRRPDYYNDITKRAEEWPLLPGN